MERCNTVRFHKPGGFHYGLTTTGHVAGLGKEYACRFLVLKPVRNSHLEDLDIDGRLFFNAS
jgi:hypothetical protein